MNLAAVIELAAERYPGADAVVTPAERFSYGEWNSRINSVAWGLIKAGIRPGDRVAICTRNGEAPATTYFAVHKAGAAAVLLNARWKYQDLAYVIQDADVRAVLYDTETRGEVRRAVAAAGREVFCISCSGSGAPTPGEAAFSELAGGPTGQAPDVPRDDRFPGTILYTSGTTGRPKGVCRSAAGDYLSALAIILEHRWERFERFLAVMPLYHTMGLHSLISSVILNGMAVLLPRPDPRHVFGTWKRNESPPSTWCRPSTTNSSNA